MELYSRWGRSEISVRRVGGERQYRYDVLSRDALGDWADVGALGEHFGLMFDLVLGHVSRHSRWFQQYVAGEEPYTDYFIEVDPATDLSQVSRPSSLPLLTSNRAI